MKIILFLSFYLIIGFFMLPPLHAQDAVHLKIDSVNALPYDFMVSHPRKAIEVFTENIKRAHALDYKPAEARAYELLNGAYFINGKWKKSTEAILQAIKIYDQIGDIENLVGAYGRLGYQQRRWDFKSALKEIRRGIRLAQKYNYKEKLWTLYDDYGVLQEESHNLDSALFYYKKALELHVELKDSVGTPFSLNNIAGIYSMKGEYGKALDYISQSDAYRKLEKGEFGRASNLAIRAEINKSMGRLDSALYYYNKSLKKAIAIGYKVIIRDNYQKITEIYELKNDFKKALETQQKAIAYNDSLLNVETNRTISELEVAYETEKKDRQIVQNKLEIRRHKSQILISIILIIALLVFVTGLYRFQSLKRKQIKNELELKNQIEKANLEQKLTNEKLRISRELHDNIGSNLTFLISNMDNMGYTVKDENILYKLKRMSSFGRETLAELRNSIWAMKRKAGGLSDLILKINELKQNLQEEPNIPLIIVERQVLYEPHFSSVQMLNLYRIVQEAVNNTIKYAGATQIKILFSEENNALQLTISDDGKGFDVARIQKGNGLQNMQHRCRETGGEWHLTSTKAGTVITCKLGKFL